VKTLLVVALLMAPVPTGREVVIEAVQQAGRYLAVGAGGRIELKPGRSVFVLSPAGAGRYLIRTGGACLGVRANGSKPLTVVTTRCDAKRAGQQFSIRPEGAAYSISNQGAYLQYFPSAGLIAQEIGDDPLATTYTISLSSRSMASG
jgi:hypothetical protein